MPGGGDAGSLLPGVLPPELGAIVMGHRQRSLINILSAPQPPPQQQQPPPPQPPQPQQSCLHSRVNRLCQPVQCQTLAVNIMMDVDRATGAGKRRRERRLRSWWRHEAQSVQAAVVSAMHHSRDVGPAKNVAPQKFRSCSSSRSSETEEDHRGGGGRARDALWPTGTDAPASGVAAGASCRAAALVHLGSGGSLPGWSGCAVAGHAVSGGCGGRRRRCRHCRVPRGVGVARARGTGEDQDGGEAEAGEEEEAGGDAELGGWQEEEEEETSSHFFTSSLGLQWIQLPASVPEAFWDEFHIFSP